jgi:hypothetical protein
MKFFLIAFTMCGLLTVGMAGRVVAEDVFRDVCATAADATACKDNAAIDPNNTAKNPLWGENGVLTTALNVITILVGIAAVISIIMAGIKYTTSGNNPQEVTNARELVLYACVALVIAGLSQVLVRFFVNKVFS